MTETGPWVRWVSGEIPRGAFFHNALHVSSPLTLLSFSFLQPCLRPCFLLLPLDPVYNPLGLVADISCPKSSSGSSTQVLLALLKLQNVLPPFFVPGVAYKWVDKQQPRHCNAPFWLDKAVAGVSFAEGYWWAVPVSCCAHGFRDTKDSGKLCGAGALLGQMFGDPLTKIRVRFFGTHVHAVSSLCVKHGHRDCQPCAGLLRNLLCAGGMGQTLYSLVRYQAAKQAVEWSTSDANVSLQVELEIRDQANKRYAQNELCSNYDHLAHSGQVMQALCAMLMISTTTMMMIMMMMTMTTMMMIANAMMLILLILMMIKAMVAVVMTMKMKMVMKMAMAEAEAAAAADADNDIGDASGMLLRVLMMLLQLMH